MPREARIDYPGALHHIWESIKATREGDKEASDERILGMGDFVETALRQANEHEDRASRLKRAGWNLASILSHTARTIGLAAEDLMVRGRANNRSQGRALFCKWMVVDLKESQINVANYLGISRPGVSLLVNQGRSVEREWDAELPDNP